MNSTQRSSHTISEQVNPDNEKQALFWWEVNNQFSVNATTKGLVITLRLVFYSTGST